ncbi:alkylhydroperoxidase AhpD family core domain-containing protein [Fodinibius roseus]|uniref:Alkylhydroperoxidase AhpD family core domain-containing protein n=1 Tax=Fodinibius roseus TaxID=1194090 RepID=A0A1M4YZZ8_9BACT|nr:carboxymuconolactone decarboxylase family protein [Fodinibius roseus]SHF11389.1 alkylhydroperoxidase AhpD family core domain-containing protein [Fodinibius roseus]
MNTAISSLNQQVSTPRLEPIEQPASLKLKIAYWYSKRLMGKVITPLKVHYARFPKALGLSRKIMQTEEAIELDETLKHLIKVYVATLNGCAFCVDIAKASAHKNELDEKKFKDLLRFENSDRFTPAEKAALAYADEATRNKHVSDETFERLQAQFSEREIVQITMLNAIENFFNLMNAPVNIGSDELCAIWADNQ